MSSGDKMFIEMFAYLDLSGERPLVAIKYMDMANNQAVINRFPISSVNKYEEVINKDTHAHGQRIDGEIMPDQTFKINGFFLDPNDYSQ